MGLPYKKMEDNGILIPVLDVSCSYKHPIRFDETLVLTLRIQNYNGVRFEMAYEGHSKETGLLSCTGTSQHCFTTPALKPKYFFRPQSRTKQSNSKHKNARRADRCDRKARRAFL